MRRYVFADEAGCFAFNSHQRSSKYFILCTVTLEDCTVGARLLELRRQLVWEGLPVADFFHATEDKQAVRDRVYASLQNETFTVEATILEKSKAQPQTRTSNARFYKYAWYYHFKGVHRYLPNQLRELYITAASVAQKKHQKVFSAAVEDVANQYYGNRIQWRTDHPPSMADPCLQVADYCTWAIQRKWERQDVRAYNLIQGRIRHEYESWRHGTRHYY